MYYPDGTHGPMRFIEYVYGSFLRFPFRKSAFPYISFAVTVRIVFSCMSLHVCVLNISSSTSFSTQVQAFMPSFRATSALRLLILESFFSFIQLLIEVNHVVMRNVWALFNRDINEEWD